MDWELAGVDGGGRRFAVVVDAGDRATVAHLRRALTPTLGDGVDLYVGARRLDDAVRLSEAGLHTAAELRADPGPSGVAERPDPRQPGTASAWELAVVGGAAAGTATPLPATGAVHVGRSPDCALRLDDPETSRHHAAVATDRAGVATLTDLGSRNGTGWRGYRLSGPVTLDDGDVFALGETVVALRRLGPAGAMPEPAEGGTIRYNRPPRLSQPGPAVEAQVPAEPSRPRGFRFPLSAVALPLVFGAVCYLMLPNAGYYLIFIALSPLMVIANLVGDRRSGRREYQVAVREYHAALATLGDRLSAAATQEERSARRADPDPAAVTRIATARTSRLFERRPDDDDFLRLRVGLGDRPVTARLGGPGADGYVPPVVHAAPVTVDLATVAVLGVAGPRAGLLALARAMLAQAAALHAPHDLGVVVITGRDQANAWEWSSWLPHTLPHLPEFDCRRLVATDAEQAEARLAELRRLIDERRAEQRATLRAGGVTGRRILVVVDGARRLRALGGLAELLADGPAAGIYGVCLDGEETDLPDECGATVVLTGESGTRARVSRPGRTPQDEVLVDGLDSARAAQVAQALAPLRVLGARWGDDADLPDTVRFVELAGLGPDPDPAAVAAGWAAHPGGRSSRVLLGTGPDGPVELDLRRDGPHALIAGTSGAGKSELLQTVVTGLALGNTPDALNVVLVDYKGGSAFAACRDLPHCVGLVTDLDGHLVGRALAALSAELRRREAILAAADAKDIEDYWAVTGGRLPRLVIVVDEFASLVEEVPEFVNGVVGIGMRGRSLGVHVVLATQRPGGVVNAEMRANLNLRVCLRVTSPADSGDVIDVPDAARISRRSPGRAYVRTGHGDLATVQTARVAWPRTGATDDAHDTVRVLPRRVVELGRPRTGRDHPVPTEVGHDGDTDLSVLVAAIRVAAERAGTAAPAGPWLPPLPELVTLAELDPPSGGLLAVPIGLADHPDRQAQEPYMLDLDADAPVAVVGMARSGRSTLLRTLALGLAARTSPADVHLYAVDYGSRALAALAALPHCGAHIDADDPDRVTRLLGLLQAEVSRRQRLLSAGDHGSIGEQRAAAAPADRLPYLVFLLDRYDVFVARHAEVDGGRLVDAVDALLRSGPSVGILPVLATDRSGFSHRIASAVATRLVLRHTDADDLAMYGLDPRTAPRTMPAGRLVLAPEGTEVQVALPAPDPDGAAQATAVERLGAAARRRWDGLDPARRPRRVDPLPVSVTLAELDGRRQADRPAAPTACTIGAGGDHLAPIDLDLAAEGGVFLVAGAPRTGRSGALAAIVASLGGRDTGALPVIAICPRPSPLRDWAGRPGVAQVLCGSDIDVGLDEALAAVTGPVAVVVDDAELVGDGAAAGILEIFVRQTRDAGNVLVAAGTTDDLLMHRHRGWLSLVRRSRCGLLLNPISYVDGEVFDLKLPRSTAGGWPSGRGLLVLRGAATPVQVPMVCEALR